MRSYNLDMANLPDLAPQSPDHARFEDMLARQLAEGVHPREIARRVYPHREDRRKKWRLYQRLRHVAVTSDVVSRSVGEETKLELLMALVPAVKGLGRMAGRRPDAAKLILEASGFYSPKTQVDHSGEIKISLNMPRPAPEEVVADAEVVEDD
jgi:hypothetical protein